jgi:hypothetical protein
MPRDKSRKHYSGVHWDMVEATILADRSATLTSRYLHMTKNSESITGIGTGTQIAMTLEVP